MYRPRRIFAAQSLSVSITLSSMRTGNRTSCLRRFSSSKAASTSSPGEMVAVGPPVARHPPHRSVRELQLIRLLPWMVAIETLQRSLLTHARPPRYHRCPPLCADGARRNERSPWCRPFPPDSPPGISRLCSNPSRVLVARSDSSAPYTWAVRPWPSPSGLLTAERGGGLPVLARRVS